MALLSTAQAAQRLGVAHRTVRDMVARGDLPATRVGRNWAVREEDLALAPPPRGPGRPRKPGLTPPSATVN